MLIHLLLMCLLSPSSSLPSVQHPPATSSQSFSLHGPPATHAEHGQDFPEVNRAENLQPIYSYSYSVSDERTGDHKSHWERRVGDQVRGEYTLREPGGGQRTVRYTADPKRGFNAQVTRNSPMLHPPTVMQTAEPASYGVRPYDQLHQQEVPPPSAHPADVVTGFKIKHSRVDNVLSNY